MDAVAPEWRWNGSRTRFPNAFILGAMKAGTTSLHAYLGAHPEIAASRVKETRFFCSTRRRPFYPPDFWERQFARDRRVRIEATHDYTNSPRELGVPERLNAAVPGARYIYLLREPIERMVSEWRSWRTEPAEDRDCETALLDEGSDYVSRSRYATQLEPYLRIVGRERLLVVTAEDLLTHRRATLERVFTFLGVDSGFWSPEFEIVRHESSRKGRPNRFGMALHRAFGERILRRLHGPQRHYFRLAFYSWCSAPEPRPVLRREVVQRLRAILEPEMRRAEEILGLRLDYLRGLDRPASP